MIFIILCISAIIGIIIVCTLNTCMDAVANTAVNYKRADELPKLPATEDVQTYQDEKCIHCHSFDGYDICRHRKHFGTVIQNTVEYCKINKDYN